jgi:SAM-dependent methyltransferase
MALMQRLLRPGPGETLLDVGCGTGHFTRRFAAQGLTVTGLDPDPAMLEYARTQEPVVPYVEGTAVRLPFPDQAFDMVTAVTSLCFVTEPERALGEMWRVARRGVLVGLLNRRSLLHRRKAGRGGYAGARWDTLAEARQWAAGLGPTPAATRWGTAVLLPGGGPLARTVERLAPRPLPWGAFLALYWVKPSAP